MPGLCLLLLEPRAAEHVATQRRDALVVPVRDTPVAEDADQRGAWPILIKSDAFAPGIPDGDLLLPPGQVIRIDAQELALRDLVNGTTIQRRPGRAAWTGVTLNPELEADIVVAGVTLRPFHAPGAAEAVPDRLLSIAAPPNTPAGAFDLPGGGDAAAAQRQVLLERAAISGHAGTTDPGLSLEIDGTLLHPETSGRTARFVLPHQAGPAILRTRVAMPSAFLGGDDHRRLGVAVSVIMFGRRTVPLDHWSLRDGWHPAERSWRWTTGNGRFLVPQGARELEITLANTLRLYPIAPSQP